MLTHALSATKFKVTNGEFLRFVKAGPEAAPPDFDKTIDRMIDGAKKFDPSKVKATDIAIAAASSGGEEA